MRLRCAACGCYVRAFYSKSIRDNPIIRVEPCKRCLLTARNDGADSQHPDWKPK